MKKLLLGIITIILLSACTYNTPKSAVESFLRKYKTLDSDVLIDMENIIKEENLSSEDKDIYREVLKKQYKDLTYEIEEEEYDDEVSYIKVKIEVYDLYKVIKDSNIYYENNMSEFNDYNAFIKYKLNKMKNTTDRVSHEIIFTVNKDNNEYIVSDLTEENLKKIHGTYNYETNM